MSPIPARAEVGINFVRWDARFLFYRDLPRPAGSPGDRVTTPVKNCWLYIFDPFGPLLFEVYADADGLYHEVDTTKHAGKDIRPFALEGQAVRPTLPLLAGQRTSKGTIPIFHWILPSPFQLPWSRFPHLTHLETNNDGPRGDFRKWAEGTRQLSHFVPRFQEDTGNPLPETAVPSPWLHAQALGRCFQIAQERWLSGFLDDTARMERKTLRSYVRSIESIVGKERFERDMLDLIDKLAFETEERHDKEQEEFPPTELVGARTALIGYLKSPRYLAMRDDALASPDPRALATFAEIQATAESGLEGVAGDPAYRASVLRDNPKLFKKEAEEVSTEVKSFIEAHPEAMYDQPASLGWKEQRKALKSYWYLVKAYIAQIEWIAPRRLTRDLKTFGRELFGVLVEFDLAEGTAARRMPDGTIKWPRLVVSPQTKARLSDRYSNNLEWNTFFVVLDAYNLIMACQEQAKGKTDMKTVVSAMGAFLNTVAAAVEATLQRQGAKHLIVTDKMIAELAEGAGKTSARKGSGSFAVTLRKFNQPKTIGAMGKLLGALGSAFEAWSQIQQAKGADSELDPDVALAHRVSAGANIAVTAGYFIGFFGTVCGIAVGTAVAWPLALVAIGSWLVLGGTVTDLGAKLVLLHLKKDPLENWLKVTPWARGARFRIESFDEQVKAFHRALVGLHVNIRPGLTGFDVTVESRVVQSPAQVYLELEWLGEAGPEPLKNAMAPMTAAEYLSPSQFRHTEFASPVRTVTARVRLLLDGEWYPEEPAVFNYPE